MAGSSLSAALLVMGAAVDEEAGQRGPALEAVVDGLAGVAVLGHPGALLTQPDSSAVTSGRPRSVRTATCCGGARLLISLPFPGASL